VSPEVSVALQLIGFVLLAAGWLVNGWLSSKRDANNKRREIVTGHLIATISC
jgi:hypothetical protein